MSIWNWLRCPTLALLVLAIGNSAGAQSGAHPRPSYSSASLESGPEVSSSSINPSGSLARPGVGSATGGEGYVTLGEDPENRLLFPFLDHLAGDQKQVWFGVGKLQRRDLRWILPAAGITAGFIASDQWWSRQVPASSVATSNRVSDLGAYSFLGLSAGSFVLGQMTHDNQLSEAGLLAGEAAINASVVAYALKEVTQRARPDQGTGHGAFFAGGGSFPSEHSAIAWSVAGVWAHEYPGWLSRATAYGLASAVTIGRVTARQHFPSDALIGSALGWYFGWQAYRAHHDSELGGAAWGGAFASGALEQKIGDNVPNPNYMASPYVPLDSWIYPALERLIALGYLQSNFLGMRPWTRMACARLLDDAPDEARLAEDRLTEDNLPNGGKPGATENEKENDAATKTLAALSDEFESEIARLNGGANVGMRLESVYSRTMEISGAPLRDSFHFGQTIVNDYGRPYWSGFNSVTGITADAEAGALSVYFRGEYQQAPAMPSDAPLALAAIGASDLTPPVPNGAPATSQVALLDSMASVNLNNVQISFGIQSLWLGPGRSSSWLMSNNAAPFPMLKIDDVAPHEIPALSRLLGPVRSEFFLGQLSGHHWEQCDAPACQSYPGYPGIAGPRISPQPLIHGEKISFQPTANFEFGMGIAAMFGGPGLPLTFGNFFRTYYVHSPVAANNPGKRISQADFTYRIPRLRNWLTIYLDALVTDEISPVGSRRADLSPGIYAPQIPRLAKMEFRAEAMNESRTREFAPGFVYSDPRRFLGGYTNQGLLLGSWIGRAGRGGQGWLTYRLSPRDSIEFSYRLQGVAQNFLEGGRMADYSGRGEFLLRGRLSVGGLVQYEQWKFPALSPTPQSNFSAAAQLTFYARRTKKPGGSPN
jgi:membrane-associated phospholipid phosphatase